MKNLTMKNNSNLVYNNLTKQNTNDKMLVELSISPKTNYLLVHKFSSCSYFADLRKHFHHFSLETSSNCHPLVEKN